MTRSLTNPAPAYRRSRLSRCCRRYVVAVIDLPYPDPTVPTPGILLEGTHKRRKSLSRPGRFTLAAVIALAGAGGLGYEALNGWPNGIRLMFVVTIPLAVLWVALLAVAAGVLIKPTTAPWYQMWSLVEYVDVPHGMRLVVGRLPAGQAGLVVRRGETVEVHAALRSSSNAGLVRYYAFRLVAPAGSIEFTVPVMIERVTMVPLESRAATWGIAITTHGDATAIQRAGVGV